MRKISVVLEELETEQHKWIRQNIEEKAVKKVLALWKQTISHLKDQVLLCYRHHAPKGRWEWQKVNSYGGLGDIKRQAFNILDDFRKQAIGLLQNTKHQTYIQTYLRKSYILDQTTPKNTQVNLNRVQKNDLRKLRETQTPEPVAPANKINTFIIGYARAFETNLEEGLVLQQDLDTILYEVGREKVGFPAMQVDTLLEGTFRTEVIKEMATATDDVAEDNPDVINTLIWQAREDTRMCDICADNNGMDQDEVEDDIPAHPYCRCYWRIVPKNWEDLGADVLAGTEGMMAGVKGGKIVDIVVISFNKWLNM